MSPDPTDDREYVTLPGVITLRPDQWYLVDPDGCVQQGSSAGWIRKPFGAAEVAAILDFGTELADV